jgi:hypothetical protein
MMAMVGREQTGPQSQHHDAEHRPEQPRQSQPQFQVGDVGGNTRDHDQVVRGAGQRRRQCRPGVQRQDAVTVRQIQRDQGKGDQQHPLIEPGHGDQHQDIQQQGSQNDGVGRADNGTVEY